MALDVRRSVPFAKSVVGGIREKNVPFMAASIAYQAFVSLIPLLVLLFFLVSVVGDEHLAAEVSATTEGVLPESGQDLLESAIEGSVATAGTSIIGLVVLLWGSLKIFRGLDTAFSEIYESTGETSFVGQLLDAVVVFGAIGTALVSAAAVTIAFAFLPNRLLIGLLNPLLLAVGLTIAFLPMYYVFPDVDVTVREILPGVVVAAVGWTALQALFQVYVAFSSGSEEAGPVGAILLLLTWLYFGALILLAGAVINAARADRLRTEDEVDETSGGTTDRDVGPTSIVDRERRDRLEEELTALRAERDQLRNDLAAQRQRRYRLEDRTDGLERERERLERENAALRRHLEVYREPGWKRLLRSVVARASTLNVVTVDREERGR